jgi:Putative restriction endonuclease
LGGTTASSQEYVLVDAESMAIEIFRKVDENWQIIDYEPGDVVELTSVNLSFRSSKFTKILYFRLKKTLKIKTVFLKLHTLFG